MDRHAIGTVGGIGGEQGVPHPAGGGTQGGGFVLGGGELSGSSLPPHIEVRTAEDGRVYYLNHRTKVTSWTVPPPSDW